MADVMDVKDYMAELGRNARKASRAIAAASTGVKNKALLAIADALELRYPEVPLYFDLGELRGYHYHTGLVFAAYVAGQRSEVAKGGRYDHVGEAFGRARPATGFSADLKQWLDFDNQPAAARGILAPAGEAAALLAAIAEARVSGQRVVQQLPGSPLTALEAGCDREFLFDDGRWQARPIVAS